MNKLLSEKFFTFNKQYSRARFGAWLSAAMADIHRVFSAKGLLGDEECVHFSDDMLCLFRNQGFLADPAFSRAFIDGDGDDLLRNRIWRLWIVAWSLTQSFRKYPDELYLDFGTYNGKALDIALRYCKNVSASIPRKVRAYDAFENPPLESKKAEHTPELKERVMKRFEWTKTLEVIPGLLPGTLEIREEEKVAWAQVDLNGAQYDLQVFEKIYPLLIEGAIVVFDDYGASGYGETQRVLDDFLLQHGQGRILELPTSQGLYIR
jgi:hypothetical protein